MESDSLCCAEHLCLHAGISMEWGASKLQSMYIVFGSCDVTNVASAAMSNDF